MIMHLAGAHAWSHRYNLRVDLRIYWEGKGDWTYHPKDTESVIERYEDMHSRMVGSERVTMEHFWEESDMFSYANCMMDDQKARAKYQPTRYFLESQEAGCQNFVLEDHWYPDWQFVDTPHRNDNTIVYWHPGHNAESIKNYKDVMYWEPVQLSLQRMFPDHSIVCLSYRDSFETAYRAIQGCDFCVGYDGMWHYVARLFGKHFVTISGDMVLPLHMTTPQEAVFTFQNDFWKHINQMRSADYRELMIDYSHAAWQRRLKNTLNTRHNGYRNQTDTYIQMTKDHGLFKREDGRKVNEHGR